MSNVQEQLDRVNSEGRYQKCLIAYLSFVGFFIGFSIYSIAFIFYAPTFSCFSDASKSVSVSCSEAAACESKFGFTVSSPRRSLITDNRLYCEQGNVYSYSVMFIFVYCAIVSFFLTMQMDFFGRKFGVLLAVTLSLASSAGALLFTDYRVVVFFTANLLVSYDLFFAAASIWANESVGGNLRSSAVSIIYFMFGVGMVFFYAINAVLTGYRPIFGMILGFSSVALPLCFLFYESPAFLMKRGRVAETNRVLSGIAKINNVAFVPNESRPDETDPILPSEPQVKKPFALYTQYAVPILSIGLVYGNLSMIYSLTSLIPQFIGGSNIYLNGILLSVVEILAYLIMALIAQRTPRRLLSIFSAVIFILAAIVLTILTKLAGKTGQFPIAETAICVLVKFVLCLNYSIISNWIIESIPSSIRGQTFAFCALLNRLLGALTGLIVRGSKGLEVNPFVFIIIGSIVALTLAFSQRETLGKPLIQ